MTQANGASVNDAPPTADMLGDLLSPLAIEGPPAVSTQLDHNGVHGHEGTNGADDALALAPVENQESTVQVLSSYWSSGFVYLIFNLFLIIFTANRRYCRKISSFMP